MKYYDYNKIKALIDQHKPAEASLGMKEDWFWTEKTIYKDGEYLVDLFLGDIVKQAANAVAALTSRLNGVTDGETLNDVCGSTWATPVLELTNSKGDNTFYEVSILIGKQEPKPEWLTARVLSDPINRAMEKVEVLS